VDNSENDPRLVDYSTELENGLFNLVVTLCQHKAATMSLGDAKAQVAEYLRKIIMGLDDSPTESNSN
jgi:hypothetical protein